LRLDEYAKLVLDAATVKSRRNIYYLMPFAERLSFVAQQLRAFNLVWALDRLGRVSSTSHVAVIGAGLSGVTTACALTALQCRVTVFEETEKPMFRQRNTSHRMAHPEINYWPEQAPLTHATELPMLEWYFDECVKVVEFINTQREEVRENSGGRLDFIYERPVEDVVPSAGIDGLVSVKCSPTFGEKFHLAIVAVGFENDRTHEKINPVPYWEDDKLESDVESGKFTTFVISGGGDGGMIDSLRCAYNFKKGVLAAAVADEIGRARFTDTILEAERRHEDRIHDAYLAIAEKITQGGPLEHVKKMLDDHLRQKPGLVILLDKYLKYPSQSAAAPIHKVMLYYAWHHTIVRFRQGELKRPHSGVDIFECEGSAFPEKSRFVIRHGADPRVGQFLLRDEHDEFKKKQKYLSPYNFSALPAPEYKVAAPYPTYDPTAHSFISHRKSYAERALRSINPGANVALTNAEDGYLAAVSGDLRFAPASLFGIDVQYETSDSLHDYGRSHV
jgi:hypothetical protein